MKKNYTHTSVLLDSSGSMASIREDVIGGFNTFITDQQKETGDLTVTLADFSSNGTYRVIHDRIPVNKVPLLTDKTFIPSGGTALLDSAAKLIKTTGLELAALDESERPEKVLLVLITDGGENDSKETTREQLAELIKHQTDKYNWQFTYIGANQDAFAESSSFGLRSNSVNYTADAKGTRKMFKGLSSKTAMYRSASPLESFSLSQDDVDNAEVD